LSTVITNPGVELYRQVHPEHIDDNDGLPMRVAFVPGKTHKGLLSTMHGRIGPQEAYRRHVSRDLRSAGSWCVTVGDATSAGCPAIDDANEESPDHVSIDFTTKAGRGPEKQASRKLRDAAVARGCRYQAPAS
jgi:hypothetical protein